MEQVPKISIIVPVYNVEEYLSKCLSSLVKQTMQDIEIIVVNDGSPDNSQSIIDEFAAQYSILRPFVKENGGLSSARNFGLEKAEGEYVLFVDSDDYIDLNACHLLYDKAVSSDADIVLFDYFRLNGKKPSAVHLGLKIEDGQTIFDCPEDLAHASSYAVNKLFRKSFLLDSGIVFPKQAFEDSAVVYNYIALAKKLAYVREPLYYYRVMRDDAITAVADKRIFDIFKSCNSIIYFYKNRDIYGRFRDEIEYLCLKHTFVRFFVLENTTDSELINSYIDELYSFLDKNFPNWLNNKYYLSDRTKRILEDNFDGHYRALESKDGAKEYFEANIKHLNENAKIETVDVAESKATSSEKVKKKKKKKKSALASKLNKFKKKVNRAVSHPTAEELTDNMLKKIEKNASKAASEKIYSLMDGRLLKRLQCYNLDILKTVHDFCEENGIQYYLCEGTLLGAIRHQGIIPWDDDIDIAMMRPDFEKFQKLWGTRRIGGCELLDHSTWDEYHLPFSKIVMMEDVGFYTQNKDCPTLYRGPYVDIFPMDFSDNPDGNWDFIEHCGLIRRMRDILLVKANRTSSEKKKEKHAEAASEMSYAELHTELNSLITQYNSSDSKDYISNYCSSYPITRETFKAEWFSAPKKVPFGEYEFYVPNEPEAVLRTVYGDWQKLPPESERTCRHKIWLNIDQIYKCAHK